MADLFLKIRRLVVILATVLATGCGSVSQKATKITDHPGQPAATSGASTFAADINRNIAAAALLQGSASSDYQIGPEDLLEITLFNVPDGMERQVTPRMTSVRVSQQGKISLPVLGEISVKGLTTSHLEQRLRQEYDKYIHNPQLGVLVREYRQRISIIGAVQKPSIIEVTGPKTLIEILAMAGGVTEKAGSQLHVYRQGPTGKESHVIDLAVLAKSIGFIDATNAAMINMPVQPGDMINIPEAGMFFVDGAVRKPGSYPLGRRYSLTQALATAGGVDNELHSNDISIFRRQGPGELQTIALNLSNVMNGNVPDPQIQPDDVIVVPTSTAKFIVKRFIGQLIGGISLGSFIGGY